MFSQETQTNQTAQPAQQAQPAAEAVQGPYFKLWLNGKYETRPGTDAEAAKASKENGTTALCYNARGFYVGGFDRGWAAF